MSIPNDNFSHTRYTKSQAARGGLALKQSLKSAIIGRVIAASAGLLRFFAETGSCWLAKSTKRNEM